MTLSRSGAPFIREGVSRVSEVPSQDAHETRSGAQHVVEDGLPRPLNLDHTSFLETHLTQVIISFFLAHFALNDNLLYSPLDTHRNTDVVVFGGKHSASVVFIYAQRVVRA